MLRPVSVVMAALFAIAVPARADTLVFAAASLKEVLDDAAAAYAAEGNDKVVLSYAASSALARQIEAGAEAQVFISADLEWMDYLAGRALIQPETRTILAGNSLVLIAAPGAAPPPAIAPGFDLAGALGDRKLAMADPDAVPAGKYAKAALTALGVWDAVAPKAVRAENVRAALAFVARGEAPYGIVYATDAMAGGVTVAGIFAADTHPPIVYPAALTTRGDAAARAFLAYLASPAGQALFAERGFAPPPQP